MPDESVKLLGVGSIALAVAAAWFLLRRWPQGRASSISRHAGAQRSAYWLFAITLTICGVLLGIFMWRWFGPTIGAGWPFYVCLVITLAFQLLTAWLPDDGSGKRLSRAHGIVAFSMAGMMLPLAACIAVAPDISLPARAAAWTTVTYMAVAWYLFTFVAASRKHFLVYQAWYIVSFYVVVLLATYVR